MRQHRKRSWADAEEKEKLSAVRNGRRDPSRFLAATAKNVERRKGFPFGFLSFYLYDTAVVVVVVIVVVVLVCCCCTIYTMYLCVHQEKEGVEEEEEEEEGLWHWRRWCRLARRGGLPVDASENCSLFFISIELYHNTACVYTACLLLFLNPYSLFPLKIKMWPLCI